MSATLSDAWSRRQPSNEGYLAVLTEYAKGGQIESCVMPRAVIRQLLLTISLPIDKELVDRSFALFDKLSERGVPVLLRQAWRVGEGLVGVVRVVDIEARSLEPIDVKPLSEALAEAGL